MSATRQPLSRALISVFDKSGVVELAQALANAGVEIVSTGSTAATLSEAGVAVTPIENVTGFPECLDGRVKTLHPKVHAGILADRTRQSHRDQLQHMGIAAFDLVVCNLYPFAHTVAGGHDFAECIEKIDIGGPTMVRAAAKNFASLAVLTSPEQYPQARQAIAAGGFTYDQRRELAAVAFAHTATYDAAVANWFASQLTDSATTDTPAGSGDSGETLLPTFLGLAFSRADQLRYGENPHQAAALYHVAEVEPTGLAGAELLGGKPMSYNNYQDTDAAWRAAHDHGDRPCVAVIKHANPCGVAIGSDIAQAHRKAHACDPLSAYGGVIACNQEVSAELAEQIRPIFTEVIAAPAFAADALEILRKKKNLRILRVPVAKASATPAAASARATPALELKPISGGLLAQQVDRIDAPGDSPESWQLVSGDPADEQTLADLEFAWRAVRAVRSNAVLLADDGATVGVGMGQVNRVDSCALAIERANTLGEPVSVDVPDAPGGAPAHNKTDGTASATSAPERARGAVCASDAFFPFADGVEKLIAAGVRAVVQPGGSVRDDEVIAAAKQAGLTMYFTGTRHFSH